MSIKKNANNAGLTLIEVLVALAVSSIIIVAAMALLTNGINSYRRNTIIAELQEEADLALRQVSDAFLEAEVLHMENVESATEKYTVYYVQPNKELGYKYDQRSDILYVVTKNAAGAHVDSVLCTGVKSFDIKILKDSLKTGVTAEGNGIVGVNGRVQMKIDIEVEIDKYSRKAARTTGVRNKIDIGDIKVSNVLNGTATAVKLDDSSFISIE